MVNNIFSLIFHATMRRQKYRVTKDHNASFPYVLLAVEGDEVSVGKEDSEMPGWFWCKDKLGVEMWVPKTHLTIDVGKAVFNQPYNSTELNAAPGELVQYIGEALGWVECLDSKWRYGWIPSAKLMLIT